MPAEPATVPAFQLVYANVEAHESANNFRGFQVWLASPELDESVRAEVSKQLADFNLPAEADPFSLDGRPLERHAFYSVDAPGGPWWVLARTVPVKDTDIYGRMGLFLVHALVLTDDAMASVGYDPFPLLDGKPVFANSRADAKTIAPEWKRGVIAALELPVVRKPVASIEPLTIDVIVEMAHHLEDSAAPPITLTERPRDVLAWLRPLFGRLPPVLRARLGFDTLYNGQSLAGAPFRVVGSYSPDVLSTWSDQRVHQWLGTSATFAPPLKVPDSCFAGVLAGWLSRDAMPSDASASATYELLQALEHERLADCLPGGLDEDELRELMQIESIPRQLKKLQVKRVRQDFPVKALWPLVQDRLPDYFRADTAAARLAKVALPLSPEQVAIWLKTRLEDLDEAPPTKEELTAMAVWLGDRGGDEFVRCRLMAQRWRGQVDWLRDNLADDERADPEFWFWPWCHRTLELRYGDGEQMPAQLLNRLRDEEVGDDVLSDVELYLELPVAEAAFEEVDALSERAEMRFLLAYHGRDVEAMREMLDGEGNRALFERALRRLERLPQQICFCCFVIEGEYYVGMKVEFRGEEPTKAAALATATYHHSPFQAGDFWRRAATRGYPSPIEQRVMRSGLPSIWDKVKDREGWDKVTEYLRSPPCTDTIYQACAEEALEMRVVTPMICPLGGGDVIWLGVKVTWAINAEAPRRNPALHAILRAVTLVHVPSDWDNVISCFDMDQTDKPRMGWLMMILLDWNLLGRLTIAR